MKIIVSVVVVDSAQTSLDQRGHGVIKVVEQNYYFLQLTSLYRMIASQYSFYLVSFHYYSFTFTFIEIISEK